MIIGKLKLDGNLILAPMSGVTNLPFRLLCKKYGAALVFSEMVCSEAIVRQNPKSMERGFTCPEERPVGIQLLGSGPDTLASSAAIMQETYNPGLIDVNLGCPEKNIIRNGFGSALLNDPGKIGKIIGQIGGTVDVPVTAKMRILDRLDDTIKIARRIENAGAQALTVHGRTQRQGYSGRANLDFIKAVKSELSIPVIANGDIFDEKQAAHVLEYTQCDGLMIGRAAIGNPFIFHRLSHYLNKGELLPPRTFGEQLEDFFTYEKLCRKYGLLAYSDLKLKAHWFLKHKQNIRSVREQINDAKDVDSIMWIMREVKTTN